MPPFSFRPARPRRALDSAAPVPGPDVLARYFVQRHLAGDSVREIAAELELDESEVAQALCAALHGR